MVEKISLELVLCRCYRVMIIVNVKLINIQILHRTSEVYIYVAIMLERPKINLRLFSGNKVLMNTENYRIC